jgi:UDP-N-acetylglucosamine 1-carboxyvinyltransferase
VLPSRLHAARLAAPDLRAGFACLVAALVAEGTSELRNVDRIQRGYADLLPKLRSLGAHISGVD